MHRQISPEEMIQDVNRIRDFFRTAQFQKAVSPLQAKLVTDEAILSEEAIQLFNQCLIYALIKLKEYKNAKILSDQVMSKL